MAPGFLLVTAEPGAQVTLDEFQDWYNNEHVPLRLNYLPSFLTGARFSAADSLQPSWLAVYDIDDTATFSHESYTRLRANRSPREANLVQRLEVLDRRTYEFVSDSGESALSSSYKPENPTSALVTVSLDFADGGDEAFRAWADEAFVALRGVDEWIRTRTYKCIDNLKSGMGVPKGPEAQIVPKYLAVHEVSSLPIGAAFSATANPGSKAQVKETRTWNLYRAYPCVAQGNLPVSSA
ncbi:hypothetical protein FB45DRAFT_1062310 [Roridomyces roridus]|uniref:EthD domain-containing protein n=1 Tax=Roridomyces roridus TaxID=1738132 RepID=A0AAD7BI15_9AGAR|nr:hypothetical protein FB45DRAFT_1062310 [Roridomyces roridus]